MNYIYSNNLSALDNMLLDSYLTQKCSAEYFRLYKWKNPTLSLGITNNKSKLDLKYINTKNVDIVRRETGGGIVFHDEDLCFSFITDTKLKPKENYLYIKNIIENLLCNLGESISTTNSNNSRSPICFEGSNDHEISVDNKKIIGIAQKVVKNRYLIQGSIQLQTTLLEPYFIDTDQIIQHGLENIKNDTIKDEFLQYVGNIWTLKKVMAENIIQDNQYIVFKQKNKHRFYWGN